MKDILVARRFIFMPQAWLNASNYDDKTIDKPTHGGLRCNMYVTVSHRSGCQIAITVKTSETAHWPKLLPNFIKLSESERVMSSLKPSSQ